MSGSAALALGRDALRRQAWGAAFAHLSSADQEAALAPGDLEELATAAHMMGKDAECVQLLTRAHQGFLTKGEAVAAARCALWLALGALVGGEPGQASGWLARAARLLDERGAEGLERGYLRHLLALRAFVGGDAAAAGEGFRLVGEVGARLGDPTLLALGLHGQGRSRIRRGDPEGVRLLDESMIAVRAGEIAPRLVGGLYCSALEACDELLDVRRAQEWTGALEAWCAAQADVVPYRGRCLVYRAELLQLHGAWTEALREARRACAWLDGPRTGPALGAAQALAGDLHRLRGEVAEAERAYGEASRWGPRPGLALLRLAQGQLSAAQTAVRHAVEAARDGGGRARALDACVEIALAGGELPGARAAAEELRGVAARFGGPFAGALAARAHGAVLLAEGDAPGARIALRDALAAWRELDAPYEAARVDALLGLACRAEGDEEGAALELQAARHAFAALGAAPDLARVEASLRRASAADPLTAREREVLALVASGRTNRAIAAALGLSDKTVARHLSNIFAKLGLGSRAAATAWAFQQGLVGHSRSVRT